MTDTTTPAAVLPHDAELYLLGMQQMAPNAADAQREAARTVWEAFAAAHHDSNDSEIELLRAAVYALIELLDEGAAYLMNEVIDHAGGLDPSEDDFDPVDGPNLTLCPVAAPS